MKQFTLIVLLLVAHITSVFGQNEVSYKDKQQYKNWVRLAPKLEDSFFQTQEAIRIAENVLLYQLNTGGWPKNIYMPAELSAAEKKAVATSQITYAQGQLLLWSAQPGYVDGAGAVLKTGTWKHLALANPKLAPYGAAGQEVLQQLGVDATGRTVLGENIAQTYQFVASGNAQLGFVAASQVMKDGQLQSGSAWVIPQALYSPIRQDAIVLEHGRNNPAAQALLDYLQTPAARAIMQAYGYR